MKIVLVGLSGGVDSSVSALLLKKQGYKVIGAFIENFTDKETSKSLCKSHSKKGDKQSAKLMAKFLGIKLIILDYKKEYQKSVISPMIKSYSSGLTPNPDILCNKTVKFPFLWKKAKTLKADCIATGHYAGIKKSPKGYQFLAGKDKTKDQSYFLYKISQSDLSHTLFPLHKYTKTQVRQIAKKNKFPNYDKPGTRGLCFIGKMDFQKYLRKKIKKKPGKVQTPEGEIIGNHPGIAYFTIGQRIGPRLGIKTNEHLKGKWYIAEKKKPNTLIIAPQNHYSLKKKKIFIKSFHKINPRQKIPKQLKARIRHLGPLLKGNLKKSKNKYIFTLKKPEEQIAEGQAIVLYHKNQVIGGGEIRLK